MKVAISSQNKSDITGHAGKTSRFWIYTVEDKKIINKELIELAREDILHMRFHESDNPYAPHPVLDSNVIITGGAGQGFISKMAVKDIEVVITDELNPDTAIEQLMNGTIHRLTPGHHC